MVEDRGVGDGLILGLTNALENGCNINGCGVVRGGKLALFPETTRKRYLLVLSRVEILQAYSVEVLVCLKRLWCGGVVRFADVVAWRRCGVEGVV